MFYTNKNESQLLTEKNNSIVNIKNIHKQMLKNGKKLDHIFFTACLAANNIKDHLIKSRSILKNRNNDGVTQQVTYLTKDQVANFARDLVIRWALVKTLLGETLVATIECKICAVFLVDTFDLTMALERLKKQWPSVKIQHDQNAILPFISFFENRIMGNSNHNMPMILNGTKFQLVIWRELLQIPYGLVVSYGDLSIFAKKEKAWRAVGTAVGQNPIAYLIPCHRVINSNGTIGQYHWGSCNKRTMLAVEHTVCRH